MELQWRETSPNEFAARGIRKHDVWRSRVWGGFLVKSGTSMHGPYDSAKEARDMCAKLESFEETK